MTHLEVREKFLEFFAKKGHKIVPSSSLIPSDRSALLTSAGMQQFKPYYTGEKDPLKDFGSQNTASIQKCFRTSDIDEVGDESHLTFFEMLGNFSFGGYFKEKAIQYAHEFITKELGLKIDYVSVFEGDEKIPADVESEKIWKEIDGNLKIKKSGKEDNFWGPTGNEGPCGPTTEIYINGVEIWNIVFNEYHCLPSEASAKEGRSDGSFEKLKTPGVDTGMGLERLAMVLQKKNNVFETDLFATVVAKVKSHPPRRTNLKTTSQNLKAEEDKLIRVIADHIKASIFLIADGIISSNSEKGYVLRRLIRRIVRYGKLLELKENFIGEIAETVIEIYKNNYSEVIGNKKNILRELKQEKEKFEKTLEGGLRALLKIFDRIEFFNEKPKKIETRDFGDYRGLGKEFFDIFSTHGFPIELSIEEINSKRKGLGWEKLSKIQEDKIRKEFNEEFKKHQEISRAGAEKKFGGHGIKEGGEASEKIKRLHTATHLLHQALREVLGEEIKQMGSDINAERLRFDFSFGRKVSLEEIKKVEDIINEKIQEDLEIKMEEMSYKDALKSGALAFFSAKGGSASGGKEKYPERVKVYLIDNFSREICGGPHAENTAGLGHFKILKEESSSAGVRRIKAVLE